MSRHAVLVLPRLDYCNAVLAGLPATPLAPLRIVLTGQPPDYITGRQHSHTVVTARLQKCVQSGELRILCRYTSCMQSPRACTQLPTELKLTRSSAAAFERHFKRFVQHIVY